MTEAQLIAAERERQIAAEGWTPDERTKGELAWIGQLVKAGALIAAEIDRLQRAPSVSGGADNGDNQ